MVKIVLISCVSQKLSHPSKAGDLYISDWFKKALAYAHTLNPHRIYILSAKYGVIPLDEIIEPYDKTLNTMRVADRRAWAENVIETLRILTDLSKDEFIFLAGQKYREFLIPSMSHYAVPMKGMGIGKQKQFMKERL